MPKLIRDLPDTSSYWAAVWTICPMPDVHVICDAPIGCFNLVATAVSDYTDAIPHIENITPSVIREEEVGSTGTGPAVQRTYEGLRDAGLLEGKRLIVISTAESEMIGSDLSDLVPQLEQGATFFHSDSLAEDEWTGRDRVLQWLWDNYGATAGTTVGTTVGDAADAAQIQPEPGLVNIIGPTYGCFNAPSDLEETRRLIEGAGGQINLIYPYEATLAQTAELARAQVNVLLYQEFGQTLAATLGQPTLQAPMGMRATTQFIHELGALLGTEAQAAAFVEREKQTTLQAVWDLWRGPQSDWFATTDIGIVATGTYVDGLRDYLGDELGMPVVLAASRPLRPGEQDNEEVRRRLHAKAPTFLFGSINERIYLSEAGARHVNYIPAAFPGPTVRRAVGTPFMGYRGAVYVLQEIVNRLYDTLFHFLPVDGAYAAQQAGGASNGRPAAQSPGNLPWTAEAKEALDAALDKLPFLSRISASRQMQMRIEELARDVNTSEVSADLVAQALADTTG